MIIGICGYCNSGKDIVADILVEERGFIKKSFATKVRQTAARINSYLPQVGETYNEVVVRLGYDVAKREYSSVREYLVNIGEGLRDILGEDLWLNAALPLENMCMNKGPQIVFSDVRHSNESLRIRRSGGFIIKLTRPGCDGFEAERRSISNVIADFYIHNDGDKNDLKNSVMKIINNL